MSVSFYLEKLENNLSPLCKFMNDLPSVKDVIICDRIIHVGKAIPLISICSKFGQKPFLQLAE